MLKNKKVYIVPILTFLLIILITAFLLKLPICSKTELSYIDAIFEAASNVTATGSNIVDISKQFTFFGQLVILIAMQIGAIGFMLFFSLIFSISKKKLKLSDTIFLSNEINTSNYTTIKDRAKKITKYTMIIELLGAWFLSLKFIPMYGLKTGLWYSIFHSVSAFCNVGTDLFGSNSLVMFKDDIYINCVFIGLMFLGSLGFFVLEDLVEWFYTGKRSKIRIESRLILNVSVILVIFTTILIKIFDPQLTIIESLFSVVTARNTGFSIIDMSNLQEINQFLIALIMFIGGGPGSNAGGIRIMVFVVLLLTTISNLKGRDDVVVFYRNINDKMIKKAITILNIDLFIIFAGILGLSITENQSVLDILFYVISYFSNTGLTTIDITTLSFAGKCISIFIMYIGKIAPITLMSLFIPTTDKKKGIKYPDMDVML